MANSTKAARKTRLTLASRTCDMLALRNEYEGYLATSEMLGEEDNVMYYRGMIAAMDAALNIMAK